MGETETGSSLGKQVCVTLPRGGTVVPARVAGPSKRSLADVVFSRRAGQVRKRT